MHKDPMRTITTGLIRVDFNRTTALISQAAVEIAASALLRPYGLFYGRN